MEEEDQEGNDISMIVWVLDAHQKRNDKTGNLGHFFKSCC